MPWEARGEGFGGEFTSSGGWQLPSAGKWDGAEPHGHGDIHQNSLLPPTAGTHLVPSRLRAAPDQLQEGKTQGSSAWDTATEPVPKERERGLFSPSRLSAR